MNETHRRLHGTDYDSLRSLADQNHEGVPQHDPLEDLARLVSEDPQNAYGRQGYVQEDFFAQEEMQLRGPIDDHLDAPQDHAAYYEQAYVNGAYPEAAYAPYDESYDSQPPARRIPSAVMLVLGVLLIASGLVNLAMPGLVATEYVQLGLGALLFIAPWIGGYVNATGFGPAWISWICGAVAVIVAALAIRPAMQTHDRAIPH